MDEAKIKEVVAELEKHKSTITGLNLRSTGDENAVISILDTLNEPAPTRVRRKSFRIN
jgi:hypothetical protein